jgi:hypothetical protein
MTTIEHCDELASDDEEDPLFSSAKAELLEISLSQVSDHCTSIHGAHELGKLNSLGISCNYLSPQPALHAKLAKSTDSFRVRHLNAGTLTGITNQELRRALKSADHFREFYGGLTERAIDLYVKGGRRKFAVKLHGLRAGISRWASVISSCLPIQIRYEGSEVITEWPKGLLNPSKPIMDHRSGRVWKLMSRDNISNPSGVLRRQKIRNGLSSC